LAFFISRKKLQNNGRFFDQQTTVLRPSKEKPGNMSGLFCVLGRGVASTPKEFQFNGHSLVLNYSD
ncbi:hypothetical protein ACO2KQ_14615, partial [Leptospira interrogans]|uniref:hypothetical protein n=1 Tax=Leptospira interrogans TaxID=173 RepID=UPI001CA551EA